MTHYPFQVHLLTSVLIFVFLPIVFNAALKPDTLLALHEQKSPLYRLQADFKLILTVVPSLYPLEHWETTGVQGVGLLNQHL